MCKRSNVSVLLGTGTGSFGAATNFGVGERPESVAIADLNGDGKLDLATANRNSGNISVLLGTGTGSFGAAINFGVGNSPYSVAIADLNGDGKLDLAVANAADDNVSVLLGTGTGSFGATTNFGVGDRPESVAIADLDGDGKLDLATANRFSNNVSVLLGTGTGSFGAATNFGVGDGPESVAIADLDGDGKLDLATANADSDNVSVLLNTSTPNTAPTASSIANVTVNEDAAPTAINLFNAFADAETADSGLTYSVFSNSNSGLVSTSITNGTLNLAYAANASGTATLTVRATDPDGLFVDTNFTVTVNAVNDAPSFTKGADQTVLEDGGAQTVPNWATAISAGPTNEAGQTLTFLVSNNNNALFSVQPAIDSTGKLTYTLANNANGTANVTVQLQDSGGTANGGVNTSPAQTFAINVTPVNDAPSFTKGADQTVLEDAGAQAVTNWATAISAGPTNEAGQTLTFLVSNNNNALFSVQPAIDSTGKLTYTLADNANGTANVTVQLQDSGGTANGGVNTSPAQTFAINVTPVNDAPALTETKATLANGTEDTVYVITAADLLTGYTDVDGDPLSISGLTATNGTLTNNNNGTYTFSPNANYNGIVNLSYTVTDGNGGSAAASQSFTLAAVNDAPVLTVPGGQSVISGLATFISGISISDVDAGTGALNLTVSVANGTLSIGGQSGSTVQLTGSLNQLNTALAGLTYNSGSFTGDTALRLSVNDNGNTGAGGALSDTKAIALSVAQNVGTLGNRALTFQGSLDSGDSVDRYRFTLDSDTSKFRLTLGGLSADANIRILDSEGKEMAILTNSGTQAEVLNNLSLLAGTYFIEVELVEDISTLYNLSFRA